MNKNKGINKIILRTIIICVPLLLLLNYSYFLIYQSQREVILSELVQRQRKEVDIIAFSIESKIENIGESIKAARNSEEFLEYFQSPSKYTLEGISQVFYRIIESNPDIKSLKLINEKGFETVKVENSEGVVQSSFDYYGQQQLSIFSDLISMNLNQSSIVLSDILINESNVTNKTKDLILRMTMSASDRPGENKSLIEVNYDAIKLFSMLEEFATAHNPPLEIDIFDSNKFWHFRNNQIQQDLDISNEKVNEVANVTENQVSNKEYFEKNQLGYYIQYLGTTGELEVRYENAPHALGILSSFDIEESIRLEETFILKHIEIPIILSLLVIGVSYIIIRLHYRRASEKLMLGATHHITQYTQNGILITDQAERTLFCNDVFENMFGYTFDEIYGNNINNFIKSSNIIKSISQQKREFWEGEVCEKLNGNVYIQKHLKIKAESNKSDSVNYFVGIFSEPKIEYNIFSDFVCENNEIHMPNGEVFDDIKAIIASKRESHIRSMLIVTKIIGFEKIKNNLSERDVNRQALVISEQLRKVFSRNDLIISIKRDMFITLISAPEFPDIEKIVKLIEDAFLKSDLQVMKLNRTELKSGVVVSSDKTDSSILFKALIALEGAIKFNQPKYMVFTDDLRRAMLRRNVIIRELEHALRNNEFRVVYQIQKSLDNKIIGVEALVRWENECLGLVSPSEFIPLLEEKEEIKLLSMFVLYTVIEDFRNIKDRLDTNFKISLNLSTKEFLDVKVIASLLFKISESKYSLNNFCFEITETTLVANIILANDIIDFCQVRGVSVSIDDFGTGYSSLGYLKKLKANKIKIDREFIKDYPERDNGAMLKAVVELGDLLGKKVIVEGVENEIQLNLIKTLKCEGYQGYLGSKPISIDELIPLLLSDKPQLRII